MSNDQATRPLDHAEPVRRMTTATPEQVWAVISDGWTYPAWVVGAPRMRAVTPDWPARGAELHHSFGLWPAMVNDKTVSLRCHEARRLVMEAHGWPFGEAVISLEITPTADGCEISISEDVSAGPGFGVPAFVRQPLIRARNREVLRRLSFVAEHAGSAAR